METRRVLVIDDDEEIRELITDILESVGMAVAVAPDGVEGVAMFKLCYGRFDAVIVDMRMPRMDGAATCRALRNFDPSVKLILSTAYGKPPSIFNTKGADVNAFLKKPYDAHELINTIQALVSSNRPALLYA